MKTEKSVRPWGMFMQYALNEECTVKVHTLKKGHKSSLQSHTKRSELFIPLDSGIVIEVDGEVFDTIAGDEVYIPVGSKHRFSSSSHNARILEISFGEFSEDDIIRHEDEYGRV